uniref:Saccharopine dehydrogenase NADP binding domain-containing protein n=1 Tax=Megaselia scalaris TaxID=36166 RepID=T1GBJ1_MEGSC
VVANTCGPYRFFGEQVVQACIKSGAHYVDISGEPKFIETMQFKYNKEAEEKGVYIISACGLDSIPSDMGTVFVEKNFNGVVNSIETYIESFYTGEDQNGGGLINFGTYESLVEEL